MFWIARKRKWGVQRKRFPEDFLGSLHDGRLQKEMSQMQRLDGAILLLEGYGQWTSDGALLDQVFNRGQMFGLLFSAALVSGVPSIRVRNADEAVACIQAFHRWTTKEKHISLQRRPNPSSDMWGRVTSKDWGLHLAQSFPGIGSGLAEAIYDHFGGIPLRWDLDSMEEFLAIPGIGKHRAQQLWEALQKEEDDEG